MQIPTNISPARIALTFGLLAACAVLVLPIRASADDAPTDSITLTSPNNLVIAESDDYATQVLGNPWEMNELDDLDFPYKFTVPQVANGIWSASTTDSSIASVWLQYQSFDGTYSYLGEKDGVNYPVDTSRFTRLRMRVNVQQPDHGVFWWFARPHEYTAAGNSRFIDYQTGWRIYDVDLTAGGPGSAGNWVNTGSVAGMRLDAPWNRANNNVQFDWVRLTAATGSPVNITWTYNASGNPNVNLYLSLSPNATQDNEMLIATVPANTLSYTWNGTGMAPGTYYIHAEMNGAWSSSGPLYVNTTPIVRIDAPGTRSGEDFAQASFGYGWEGAGQFQRTDNLRNVVVTPEYYQASATNGDSQVYWLVVDNAHQIDTGRYRYLSLDLYVQAPAERPTSPFNAGPRVLWSATNPISWQHSQNVLARYNMWMSVTYDMPVVPLVAGSYGWSGMQNTLRFDPHEDDDAYGGPPVLPPFFRIKNARLTSRPISGPGTLIRWTKVQGGGTVDFYRDNDNSGYNGTLIASDVPVDAGSYVWNTGNLPNGTYWVYAVTDDGRNSGRWYSLAPLVVDHASHSTIFSDVPTNHWAAQYINDLGLRGIINGYKQSDNTLLFRPSNTATRGQLSKMVVLAAGWQLISPPSPTFADVPPSDPAYAFVETAAQHGVVGGYPCGGPGEPCGPGNKPYFRPGNNVTRAQTAKMIAVSRGWPPVTPSSPTFADVPPSSNLYGYVEAAAQRGVLGGYSCGGPGEPCDPQSRPYFRPGYNVTRAQLSKMLSSAITVP